MVSVAVRAAPAFAATENATLPFPLPDAPLVIVIQGADEVAVQVQSAVAVTATLPVPPAGSTDCVVGEMVYEHGGGAAGCVTVSVAPAIVMVPLRAAPAFAAAV